MVSYFGEVVHPSSRAFWNDDDDDEAFHCHEDNLGFSINWTNEEPVTIKKFILIEGQIVAEFTLSCVLKDADIVGNIENKSEKPVAKIYKIDDVYICVIDSNSDLTEAGELTKTLSHLLSKIEKLYAITADHLSNLKSTEEIDSESTLKLLCSSKAAKENNFKDCILNQPNIVTGLSAGVLTYADIQDIFCIIYILYTDTFDLDSKNASPLTKLFSTLMEKPIPQFKTSGPCFFNKGNLYM
ncbi:proteasome assembly chaperone 1 [Trichogramma pretiosum]|uniref:proteasome assembly chaperone 1 n=1 Tax=Trichogramma pretiosum TaxID=7493 RepID=UPI0006C98128|nr:proteasome assembly chaperone 1 [Trichogramma pretiosum]